MMIISHKHKFLFIEVPKTASTSIKNALVTNFNITDISELNNTKDLDNNDFICGLKLRHSDGNLLQYDGGLFNQVHYKYHDHLTLKEALTLHPCIKDYFKFAFVRNPWDAQVSTYHYYKNGRVHKKVNGLGNVMHPLPKEDELTYYEKSQECSFKEWTMKYGKITIQSDLLNAENAEMDFIGKFENIQEDFNTICDKIGMNRITVPHKNASHHEPYQNYYDDEVKDYMKIKTKSDIERFNYKF